jgi:hypothetical protein
MDPTKQATLQRALPDENERPLARRSRAAAVAPGYSGRKRADAIRSRMTVLLTHAGQWILTRGKPGNGHRTEGLDAACTAIGSVLDTLQLPRSMGVVRWDGEYGHAVYVARMVLQGLGYLGRCVDYRLLDHPEAMAMLAQGSTVRMRHPDTGIEREVFDVPSLQWFDADRKVSVQTRVVITRRAARRDGKKERIGRKIGEWVYELFVTDRDRATLRAEEVVSLYLGRGTMEAALGLEDQASQIDRWVSHHGPGQEFWQILCQWMSNERVRLGRYASETPYERTLIWDVPVSSIEPVAVVLPPPQEPVEPFEVQEQPDSQTKTVQDPQNEVAPAVGEPVQPCAPKPVRFGIDAFSQHKTGEVHCPTGHPMKLVERKQRVSGLRLRYEVPAKICAACPIRIECRGPKASILTGRRIDLRPITSTEQPCRTVPQNPAPEPMLTSLCRVQNPQETHVASTESKHAGLASIPERSHSEASLKTITRMELDRVQTPRPPVRIEPPPVLEPVLLWHDLAAAAARRELRETLLQQRVTIEQGPQPPAQTVLTSRQTRNQRAHRRKTWAERLTANERAADARPLHVRIAGVPKPLGQAVGIEVAA